MALKIVGGLLMAFGGVDFAGSFAGFDLWGTIGIPLPDIVWQFSAYLEIAAGYGLFQMGNTSDQNSEEA